jgi:plastocyanin
MHHHPKVMITLLAASLALASASAVAAQDEASPDAAASMDAMTIQVSGVDYAFEGLPESVPAGTVLTFKDDGTEIHEMAVVRILDETTPLEELMAMPPDQSAALSEFVGFAFAFPGQVADGSIVLDQPGRYVALCNVHQGSDPKAFEALGIDPTTFDPENVDPDTLSPEVKDLMATIDANPAHMELGMIQEFTVTPAEADVAPMPSEEAA